MSKLQIRLLGPLEISEADTLMQVRLTSASQKLLAYLLLNIGKMCRREVLMDVFWQDNRPERARSCLNSALWRLRRELDSWQPAGTNYLLTTDAGEIGFNWESDYWLDLQVFEQKLATTLRKPVAEVDQDDVAQIEHVLGLYQGELLEGIYDDWALVERERLRLLYGNALTYLMNYYTNSGAPDKALRFAKALLAQDPLREDIHRNVIRLYLSAGQRGLAVQQYRACATILDRELSIVPMGETQQLYQQILNSADTHLPTGTANAPLDLPALHLDGEQTFRNVVRILDQAHNHLRQAAHLLARLKHLNVDI